ncbi:MAG TPA: DUF262 domain-containing protein [Chitinophagales bacterium]|nr:DUF262 domain-containing protein [Chitinophagales bacterium]
MSEKKQGICSIKKLFSKDNFFAGLKLHIPEYQRPYKWTKKNVSQLLEDIKRECQKDVSAYRLGTIVFHKDNKTLDIVDGQQRTITLLLILKALIANNKGSEGNELRTLVANFQPEFTQDISKENIYKNYQDLKQATQNFSSNEIDFLLNRCELVYFILDDLSEAFQFFDSQNSRGKDLDPHDLLKAYHLREFTQDELPKQAQIIDDWEAADENDDSGENKLSLLFSDVLFRIKNWSMLRSARYFSKNDVGLFKGLNLAKHHYPHSERIRMINFAVNEVKHYYKVDYPFQLSEPVVNGKNFFEMINHYNLLYNSYRQFANSTSESKLYSVFDDSTQLQLNDSSRSIFRYLNNSPNRNRTGDQYVRMMFDCALLFYFDKFGISEINRAIERLFAWAYSLRMHLQAVRLASIDNYAIGQYEGLNHGIQVFSIIKNALLPDEVLKELQQLKVPKLVNKDDELEKLLTEIFPELKNHE